jgi:hypothetical protein
LTALLGKEHCDEHHSQTHAPHNTGWSGEMKKIQVIRIAATTIVDFVFCKLQKLRERFDRTLSACADLAVGGNTVDVMIYQP